MTWLMEYTRENPNLIFLQWLWFCLFAFGVAGMFGVFTKIGEVFPFFHKRPYRLGSVIPAALLVVLLSGTYFFSWVNNHQSALAKAFAKDMGNLGAGHAFVLLFLIFTLALFFCVGRTTKRATIINATVIYAVAIIGLLIAF